MFTEHMMFGTKLANGVGLTIVGMGVVFAALILISLTLDVLRLAAAVLEKNDPGPAAMPESRRNGRPGRQIPGTENEEELVAVMTAAVAAHLETEMERVVITAIRPEGRFSSPWSLAGRQQQMKERLSVLNRKGKWE